MAGILEYLAKAQEHMPRTGILGLPVFGLDPAAALRQVPRGMLADTLGAPVDMTAAIMSVPRMLGAPTPDFRNKTG